ncbi:MAG: hypothetical protein JW993_02105 [Sedimentisphaerales bacterium]|nr:hypothetical protein [Sedimentisphaerales bacterium]
MTTNTTELFVPEDSRLALPATTAVAFVDGVACPDLVPFEIVRGGWPEFGSACLICHHDAHAETATSPLEHVEDRFGLGQTVCLQQLYRTDSSQAVTSGLTIFAGRIETIETSIDSDGERVEMVARDFSAVLERITVYGRRVRQANGQTALLTGLDTTFNPSGQGNASLEPVAIDGKTFTAFAAGTSATRPWSCAEVIDYLLCEYLPVASLHRPGRDQLEALTQHQLAGDLDVTGLSLLQALQYCCEYVGLAFRFEPCLLPSGPTEAVVFYRNGQGRAVELNRQPQGGSLSLSRTNVATLHSRRQFYPVTHRYIGQGDFKVYEATFDLVKAWDPVLEDADFAKFSPSTNPAFYQLKDVYRKWCLNEAGDYTPAPYSQGEPFDLSAIFEGAAYVRQRRRFWPALTANAQGRSLGYKLEVSRDGGLHWYDYPYAFDNLLDECGVWLSSDRLDMETWIAAQRDNLKFRITASIVSDERLTAVVADGPVGSPAPVVDHVITLPRRFRYRKVSAQSRFAQAALENPEASDQIDDSAALHEFVRRTAAASSHVFETVEVQTPSLLLHFQPGDRVTSNPDSRDLLACRRDNRSLLWIERVHMDFARQCTQLKVARRRL